MKISANPSYLTLARATATREFEIALSTAFDGVIANWSSSTRVSPVFAVTEPYATPSSYRFKGKWNIAFLGPISPAKVLPHVQGNAYVWLSLGLMNLVVALRGPKATLKLRDLCGELNCAIEVWEVKNGKVGKMSPLDSTDVKLPDMTKVLQITTPPALKAALVDYCPMIAAAIVRGQYLPKRIQYGLRHAHSTFADELLSSDTLTGDNAYKVLTEVLSFHSGLSRFVAQTLVGIPPIAATESHYWGHSLLGIGTADIALWNICHFLQEKLGELRIPERVLGLADTPNSIDHLNLKPDTSFPDYLSAVKLENADASLVLQIPFFSSRDGYTSKATTISAPISAITACNSMRWSLLTVTHEFIHPIVQEILRDIIPEFEDQQALEACCALLHGTSPMDYGGQEKITLAAAPTVHQEIRRLVLIAMIMVQTLDKNSEHFKPTTIKPAQIVALCEAYGYDAEETLVHLIDFHYIYQRKPEYYIPAIWTSWGTVPNVASRVKEYVVRTVVAVVSKFLRRGMHVAISTAREQVRASLSELQKTQQGGRYVTKALAVVEDEDEWESVLRDVLARVPLINLAVNFLFSEALSGKIHQESALTAGHNESGGYKQKYLELDEFLIDNPLLFISTFTTHDEPSASKSAWLLTVLAHGVNGS